MRIDCLHFIAYGPFTDTVLDLSKGDEGLHLVYGRNEAGKSSALRALRHILFGIPERSADDFVHPYAKMRIGATLRSGRGEVLTFIRRKGRMNTLRKADDESLLEEKEVKRFLPGVDADFFSTMFAIGYEDLVQGGQEIIRGGGNIGGLVFAAGSGITNLREIQDELQAGADTLFRPSGKNPKINQALSQLNRDRKALRHAELSGQDWASHDSALRKAVEERHAIEKELAVRQARLHRLKRFHRALPIIARRLELLEKRKPLELVVLLADEFGERRVEFFTKLRVAKNDRAQARETTKGLEEQLANLHVEENALSNAVFIEEIYQELGSQTKAAKDRVQLDIRRAILRSEAKEILQSLRGDMTMEDVEKLRIKKTDTIWIHDLSARYERIVTRMGNALDAIPRLERNLSNLEAQRKRLPKPHNTGVLEDILDKAAEASGSEMHCRAEAVAISAARQSLEANLKQQTLWQGSVEKLRLLPVPSAESIGTFEDRFNQLDRDIHRLKEDVNGAKEGQENAEKQLETLRLEQDVPTEGDLRKAREKRDQGWKLIRETLEGQLPSEEAVQRFMQWFVPAKTLTESYEKSVRRADVVSDRLRREADRVAKVARFCAEQNAQTKRLASLEMNFKEKDERRSELCVEWEKLWEQTGVVPQSPREMRAWAHEQRALVAKAVELYERKTKLDDLQAHLRRHRENILQCLRLFPDCDSHEPDTLTTLVQRGRRVVEREKNVANQKDRLNADKEKRTQELREAQGRFNDCKEELRRWKVQWKKAVLPLGLDGESVPAQAHVVLDEVKDLFDKLKEAESLQRRIFGIDRDVKLFSKKVRRIVESTAADLCDLPTEEASIALNNRLKSARKTETERKALKKQLQHEKKRAEKATLAISKIENELQVMCEEARCAHYDDLLEAERLSAKRRTIESALEAVNEQLRQLSAGSTVDDFVGQALKQDSDTIESRIPRLELSIKELNNDISQLDRTIGREETELKKMDGSAQAAELAEDLNILLAGLENDIVQYARLKIAARILGQAIERYRDKTQGPILKRASALFAKITGGAFEGIRAEFDVNGHPVLVGIRSLNEENVHVEGMSDGTADQLYLALRLAGLEMYMDHNEPIPFIVDDILVKFDDHRALAALQALAELSSKTQVIFFTHHRHLVELAENNIHASLVKKTLLDARA